MYMILAYINYDSQYVQTFTSLAKAKKAFRQWYKTILEHTDEKISPFSKENRKVFNTYNISFSDIKNKYGTKIDCCDTLCLVKVKDEQIYDLGQTYNSFKEEKKDKKGDNRHANR